ncbi:antitoxin [Streptacidiphilus sp. P02-A3a]|uniref:antitoxin n=1 Tax=Streptacidiphilus sp. P02-A3a TaxID=2704468 RepID=UPI0015F8D2DA|nr:antitoxin [Streptacidiphilus sp. P02-A3a]QMU71683.1 antitoxin [Streptacidiphilus sp. P02-A3a]
MGGFEGFAEKAEGWADSHPDQVREGIDKAEQGGERLTGDRYSSDIERAGQALADRFGQNQQDQGAAPGGQDSPEQQPNQGERYEQGDQSQQRQYDQQYQAGQGDQYQPDRIQQDDPGYQPDEGDPSGQ